MSESVSSDASITFIMDGIRGFGSALLNAQSYELFVDEQKVGVLDGYNHLQICITTAGPHSIYVRAYARDSASVTRVYGYSQTLDINLSAGERKNLYCGVVPGPPLRKYLIFGGVLITILLLLGVGPVGSLPLRTRYILVTVMAALTLAGSWYGYSLKPGANIYLRAE